jgi:hypothetical protein
MQKLVLLWLLLGSSLALEVPLTISLGKPFRLDFGGNGRYLARYVPSNWNLEFVGVLNDSRCPVNVDCVWAGDAEVKLRVFKGKQQKILILHTGLEPRSATVMGLKLTLQRLEPQRGAPGKTQAVLVVTKP